MNRKTKNKISRDTPNSLPYAESDSKSGNTPEDSSAEASWQKDIEKHDYYYDDSHGYKVFNPDEDDEEDDN